MIQVVPGPKQVAQVGAHLVAEYLASRARQEAAQVSLVLAGGLTPARLYALLAGQAGSSVPWAQVTVFWGDERCVPPDDHLSNYHMALTSGLLARCFAGIYRFATELSPEEAARVYEEKLRELHQARTIDVDVYPRFDVILLGLGDDGHIASLFPGTCEVRETVRWVTATEERGGIRRVTLTMPVLASARRLIFLVSGESKAEALRSTLSVIQGTAAPRTPARLLLDMVAVKELAGWGPPEVTWLVDEQAATLLPSG